MKLSRLTAFATLVLLFLLAGCDQAAQQAPLTNYLSLVNALHTKGATVVPVESVKEPFFSITGQVIAVNGKNVQVYEYVNEDAANADAARISSDGSTVSIGSSSTVVDWVAPPHFFKQGQMIVLYVGTDAAVLKQLRATLGDEFAGSKS